MASSLCVRHLGEALDTVRKTESVRLTGKGRRFIKGQKYTLLSLLLKANRRLSTAYILKEESQRIPIALRHQIKS